MRTPTSAFTVVELLVVVAVVGILAAVLLPQLLASRQRSADAVVKAFLNEVSRLQEVHQIDEQAYASTYDVLQIDLPDEQRFSELVDATLASDSSREYCASVRHPLGSGPFHVSEAGGLESGVCP